MQLGFPTLIPQDSLTGAEWQEWKDHLEKFQARRMARVENPQEAIVKLAEHARDVPKHLSEFTTRSPIERLGGTFEVASRGSYSGAWYSPTKIFLSFRPKTAAVARHLAGLRAGELTQPRA